MLYSAINLIMICFYIINIRLEILIFEKYFLNIILMLDLIYIFISIASVTENNLFIKTVINNRYLLLVSFLIIESLSAYYINDFDTFNVIQLFLYLPIGFMTNRIITKYYDEQNKIIKLENEKKNCLFDLLSGISSKINYPLEIREITKIIIDTAVKITNASSGAFFIADANSASLNIDSAAGNFPSPSILPIKIGETSIGAAAENGKAVFYKNAVNNQHVKETFSEKALVTSIIITPIIIDNNLFGVISLIKNIQKEYFSDEDFYFSKIFSGYCSASIKNIYAVQDIIQRREIEREIEISTFIQKKLINKSIPKIPNRLRHLQILQRV